MSINKNALLRYQTLDKCLSNSGRKYSFNDLLEAVNKSLSDYNPNTSGIQARQLREDIRFMKSSAGYSAPIESVREGGGFCYRYSEKDYSINNTPLNKLEVEQLQNAISVLQRFEGAPGFEWMSEITPMISNHFNLHNSEKKVMGFESNIDYSGYEHISTLFNAIINKRVVNINYHPFNSKIINTDFHPYYLKQYNNRWFLLGRNELVSHNQWNMPLDRIESITEIKAPYINDTTDWEDYFYDVIGVTVPDEENQEVTIVFSAQQSPYVFTKPLHPSQKVKQLDDGRLEVRLNIKLNYELETLLLSFGENVEVIAPNLLKERIKKRLRMAVEGY